MPGMTRVNFDSAHDAANGAEKAGQDCVDARDASQQNKDQVIAAINDIQASRSAVQGFMDDLRSDLSSAETLVANSDWESGSKDRFQQHVAELNTAMNQAEARYSADYEAAMNALEQLKFGVETLHTTFSAACLDAETNFRDSARVAHDHIDRVQVESDTGIR